MVGGWWLVYNSKPIWASVGRPVVRGCGVVYNSKPIGAAAGGPVVRGCRCPTKRSHFSGAASGEGAFTKRTRWAAEKAAPAPDERCRVTAGAGECGMKKRSHFAWDENRERRVPPGSLRLHRRTRFRRLREQFPVNRRKDWVDSLKIDANRFGLVVRGGSEV